MRFFIAGLYTETNSFSPIPTGGESFERWRRDSRGIVTVGGLAQVLGQETYDAVAAAGHEIAVDSLFAFAQPAGPTQTAVYEAMRDEILADLRDATAIDAVLLSLHGAMQAADYEDCEGDLLARVRAIVGPDVAVGVVLDPHMHLTELMLANADALVLLKEYPHTDGEARTAELIGLLVARQRRSAVPVTAVFDCRMIGIYPTTQEPARAIVRRMQEIEREPGILSVSWVHGFPWGDVAEVGARVLVIANGDRELAQRWADTLGHEIYSLRRQLVTPLLDIDAALDIAASQPGLSVIADVADNAGGGAPGDNTFILRRLLLRRLPRAALGALYDPMAVQICFEAGVGATLKLRVGGKLGPSSDSPLDLIVRVSSLAEDLVETFFQTMTQSLGRCAAIEVDGVHVLLCSKRVQTFTPTVFEAMGIELSALRAVVVKSTQHFEDAFGPLAARVLKVAARGAALDTDFASFAYTKRDHLFFPRVEDPLNGTLRQEIQPLTTDQEMTSP
jgi:microcystin degradation protein MlrC